MNSENCENGTHVILFYQLFVSTSKNHLENIQIALEVWMELGLERDDFSSPSSGIDEYC